MTGGSVLPAASMICWTQGPVEEVPAAVRMRARRRHHDLQRLFPHLAERSLGETTRYQRGQEGVAGSVYRPQKFERHDARLTAPPSGEVGSMK
jgi:hypothetical protein